MIRWILLGFCIVGLLYDFMLMHMSNEQRKKPLPFEVADVYDKEKYRTFMEYKRENRTLAFIEKMLSFCIDMCILFSPFFVYMEHWFTNNPYLLFTGTFLTLTLINGIFDCIFEWISTFHIEEKYGKNKKTKKEFWKDFAIENGLNLVTSLGLFLPIIYVCEHMVDWTNHFSISYSQSFLLTSGIVLVLGMLVFLFACLSIVALKKQYKFTELEEGDLRNSIEDLMKDCKKKVKKIEVYDESKKSTSKNAFVLKLCNYRQIGIADNFLLENSKRELLGVLAHEVGHLKHKKNGWNYSMYLILAFCFLGVVYGIVHGNQICQFSDWILVQFGLQAHSYYVYMLVYSVLLSPLVYGVGLFKTYVTRQEEYEADRNAVQEGYGEDLIQLFKELSKDELMDVNPSVWVERLTYDHPGMYHRICAIRKEEKNEL